MECFVCLQNEAPLIGNICKCKTRALHPRCQKILIQQMHTIKCSVCCTPYSNVNIIPVSNSLKSKVIRVLQCRCKLTTVGKITIVGLLIVLLLIFFGTLELILLIPLRTPSYILVAAVISGVMFIYAMLIIGFWICTMRSLNHIHDAPSQIHIEMLEENIVDQP
jgi:hypothetical protein